MTTNDRNKEAATAYFERVLNDGDMNAANEFFETDLLFHYPLGNLEGAAAVKQYVAAVRVAFPDVLFTVAEMFGENDRVAARWSMSGTQTGSFKGQAPSNRKVSLNGITVFRLSDAKIQEMWIAFDPARLIEGVNQDGQ